MEIKTFIWFIDGYNGKTRKCRVLGEYGGFYNVKIRNKPVSVPFGIVIKEQTTIIHSTSYGLNDYDDTT